MGQEIEAKFRVDEHEHVRDRLQTCGATFIERVLETNHLLDRAAHPLRKEGCGLRVRTTIADPVDASHSEPSTSIHTNDSTDAPQRSAPATVSRHTTLTFKGPRQPGPLKSREEIETEVADADALLHLFERLGFKALLVFQKRRESWALGDCRIELDEPPHIGLFVEIEGPDERHIRDVQAQLGLSDAHLVHRSYVHLLMDYSRRHALPMGRFNIEP